MSQNDGDKGRPRGPGKPGGGSHGAARGARPGGGGKGWKGGGSGGAQRDKPSPAPPRPPQAGLPARQLAVHLIAAVLRRHRALDDVLAETTSHPRWRDMPSRDRALARLIAGTVLRTHGRLAAVLLGFLGKPLPENQGNLWPLLLAGAAQLLVLGTPPHAAISLAVDQVRTDPGARRFDKLVNAVLRRVATEGPERFAALDAAAHDIPAWLLARWTATYGDDIARRIALASLAEAPLDLTAKADAAVWAEKLGGELLPTGTIRLAAGGRIDEMPGFAEGAWWVQDAAAALPARLLGDVSGREVADLCAAPGGKTAELAAAGARVTAVELSAERLSRLADNLRRLGLAADTVTADAATWEPGRVFDAVLVDAPCTATGTIRRHPDILYLKRSADFAALPDIQAPILANAARLVRPGGRLVYCVCSLEPDEGPRQIAAFLAANPEFARQAVTAEEVGGLSELIDAAGDLRTLPFHMQRASPDLSGLDGFYAARLVRAG